MLAGSRHHGGDAWTATCPPTPPSATPLVRDVEVYDAAGTARNVTLTFTKTGDRLGCQPATTATGPPPTAPHLHGRRARRAGAQRARSAASPSTCAGVTGYAGLTTVAVSGQNGRAGRHAGVLHAVAGRHPDRLVQQRRQAGPSARIALANFTNPGGLEKAGGSSLPRHRQLRRACSSVPPGDRRPWHAAGGSLEMSNVDLSQEFTNLIVAQRGFQANARIITTSDEVLQELTNLKR